jgi:hypothetical protein
MLAKIVACVVPNWSRMIVWNVWPAFSVAAAHWPMQIVANVAIIVNKQFKTKYFHWTIIGIYKYNFNRPNNMQNEGIFRLLAMAKWSSRINPVKNSCLSLFLSFHSIFCLFLSFSNYHISSIRDPLSISNPLWTLRLMYLLVDKILLYYFLLVQLGSVL